MRIKKEAAAAGAPSFSRTVFLKNARSLFAFSENQASRLLMRRAIIFLRRVAVLRCMTPLTTALSMTLCAMSKLLTAASPSFASTASRTFLTAFLHRVVQYRL